MLTTARVEIPAPVVARLKHAADYSDNVNDYAREDLIGFKRPLAATFALLLPLTLAFAYYAGGPMMVLQLGLSIILMVAFGIYVIGRQEWPNIVAKFQDCVMTKRKAIADLRCGFGESSFLSNGRAPQFFEHANGVLALADAGDLKTLFFDISKDGSDPRWALYQSGEIRRRVWRWLRLPVSREVVKFSTEGARLARVEKAPMIPSIEAWEAINVSLGEPMDGAIIHRPFDEVIDDVNRLMF
ncbi:hypothetical protein [Hyphococcus luteus]|uniref:Uncharacterized protein n=1 Tax=Hyphococcus luteus TaxID=2058213 RepID=A0A2S7JZF5_9PROT|nr:hypothetical protein [Marinicaulis flavus]PQA85620.1 hypothetical protein CW354_22060 [Marinicaulis flavus]